MQKNLIKVIIYIYIYINEKLYKVQIKNWLHFYSLIDLLITKYNIGKYIYDDDNEIKKISDIIKKEFSKTKHDYRTEKFSFCIWNS